MTYTVRFTYWGSTVNDFTTTNYDEARRMHRTLQMSMAGMGRAGKPNLEWIEEAAESPRA